MINPHTYLVQSTTFQFAALVLIVSGLAAANGALSWQEWINEAVILVGIYASKEGVRYGATAIGSNK